MGPIQTIFLDEPKILEKKKEEEFFVAPDTPEPFYASAVY
jgi:hypothetical protein